MLRPHRGPAIGRSVAPPRYAGPAATIGPSIARRMDVRVSHSLDPTIETARLTLRPMRAEDVDHLLPIFADPRVMASFGSALFDREQMEQWVRRNLDHQAQHGYGLFSVILRESGLLVGDCGLEVLGAGAEAEVEFGYDVRSDHWSRGLATEAASAVRDYAFQTLKLPRLVSLIRTGNGASRRVTEKVGMRLSATVTRQGLEYWLFEQVRDVLGAVQASSCAR